MLRFQLSVFVAKLEVSSLNNKDSVSEIKKCSLLWEKSSFWTRVNKQQFLNQTEQALNQHSSLDVIFQQFNPTNFKLSATLLRFWPFKSKFSNQRRNVNWSWNLWLLKFVPRTQLQNLLVLTNSSNLCSKSFWVQFEWLHLKTLYTLHAVQFVSA